MSLKSLIASIFGLKTEDEYNHLKDTNTKLMTEVTQCEAENKELQTKLQTALDKYDTLTATHNAEIAEAKQTISDNEAKIKSLNNTVVDLNATISQKNDQITLLTCYKDNKKTKSFYISEADDEEDTSTKASKDKK